MPRGIYEHKKGRPVPQEVRDKISARKKGITTVTGETHGMWKGESAGYAPKHQFINLHFGKATHCENPEGCVYPRKNRANKIVVTPKIFEWALIKGHSYSHNRDDYMMLCPSCHRKYDSIK